MARLRDPAVLELERADREHEHLLLRVFPVEESATVVFSMELPRTSALVFDPGQHKIGSVEIEIDGGPSPVRTRWSNVRAPRTIELGTREVRGDWTIEEPSPLRFVDTDTSLIVNAPPDSTNDVLSDRAGLPTIQLDGGAIRKVVKMHLAQLKECYMHEAQWGKPDLAGTAILRFTIAETGKIVTSSVESDLGDAAVASCLTKEVAGWEFYESNDGAVEVSYPLEFRAVN